MWRLFVVLGALESLWFSIAYLYPPESPLQKIIGIEMGFLAISSYITVATERICEAIEKSKKQF